MFTVTIRRAAENTRAYFLPNQPRYLSHEGSARHRSPKRAYQLALQRLVQAEDKNGGVGPTVQWYHTVHRNGVLIGRKII